MRFSLRQKLVGLVLVAVLACLFLGGGLLAYLYANLDEELSDEAMAMARNESALAAKSVLNLVRSQGDFFHRRLNSDLNVAISLLTRAGKVSLGDEMAQWNAMNQETNQIVEVELPQLLINGSWIGQISNFSVPSPVVDDVRELVGGACTLFQRMNEAGDMLRVSTNVATDEKTRAIGTFIPVADAKGNANPIVKSLLEGMPFVGRATVLKMPYLGGYQPLLDEKRRMIGALFVGIPLDEVQSLREGIAGLTVGDHGSVMVIGMSGGDRGRCLVSRHATRDGRLVLHDTDVHGKPFYEEIMDKASTMHLGQIGFQEYQLRENSVEGSRRMVAAFTYYRPWDWLIVSVADLADYELMITDARWHVKRTASAFAIGGLILLLVFCGTAYWYSGRLSQCVALATQAARQVSQGQLVLPRRSWTNGEREGERLRKAEHAPHLVRDETWGLLLAVISMTDRLREMLVGLRGTCETLSNKVSDLSHASRELPDGQVQAEISGREIVMELRELSTSADRITEDMGQASRMAEQATTLAEDRNLGLDAMAATMRELREAAGAFALRLEEIHQKTTDVDKIVDSVARVSEQTDLLAVNAAIEAEKAGQHGAGFAVVAREVRRLSDQTAVASEGIGTSVREMHAAVSAGIMSMDKFADKVRRGAEEIERVAGDFPQLFEDVRLLAERIEILEQNGVAYFRRARRVTEAAATLAGQVERSAARLQTVGGVTRDVQNTVSGIYDLVDGIKVEE